jgi:hypothetical protein
MVWAGDVGSRGSYALARWRVCAEFADELINQVTTISPSAPRVSRYVVPPDGEPGRDVAIPRLHKEQQDALALRWREVIVQWKPLAPVGPRRWPQSRRQAARPLPRLTDLAADDSPSPAELSQLRPDPYPAVSTMLAFSVMSRASREASRSDDQSWVALTPEQRPEHGRVWAMLGTAPIAGVSRV